MDLIVVVGLASFFVVATGYVKLCERIVGRQSVIPQSEVDDRG
jgi:hypothetical protein